MTGLEYRWGKRETGSLPHLSFFIFYQMIAVLFRRAPVSQSKFALISPDAPEPIMKLSSHYEGDHHPLCLDLLKIRVEVPSLTFNKLMLKFFSSNGQHKYKQAISVVVRNDILELQALLNNAGKINKSNVEGQRFIRVSNKKNNAISI